VSFFYSLVKFPLRLLTKYACILITNLNEKVKKNVEVLGANMVCISFALVVYQSKNKKSMFCIHFESS